jgi:hypothetical protein
MATRRNMDGEIEIVGAVSGCRVLILRITGYDGCETEVYLSHRQALALAADLERHAERAALGLEPEVTVHTI